MTSFWISAIRETTTGNAIYGSEIQLRRAANNSTTWIVSRRVAILYQGRNSKVWEFNWEIDRITASKP